MLEAALTFDEASHTYALGGNPLPGVTTVLHPLTEAEYRAVDRETMERSALLGKAVHKMIELDLAGTLDEDSLSEPLLPYLDQWRQFLALSGFKVLLSEQQVHSTRYGYAGTLDLAGKLNGRYAVIDAKRTASVPHSAGPQTAAYREALAESRGQIPWCDADRYALHMTPEHWRLVPFTDPNDRRVFLAALTLHNYRKAHGLL